MVLFASYASPWFSPEPSLLKSVDTRNLCRNYSFAPSELVPSPLFTQGLRRGLYSAAASRLIL